MAGTIDLTTLMVAISKLDHNSAADLLTATPSLAAARLARGDEFFLAERLAQVYEGDTALHAAGFSYDPEMARELIIRGADIRARNRRGSEPLHAAVIGVPGSPSWNPTRQRDVILYLIEAGAESERTRIRRCNAIASCGSKPMLGCRRGTPACRRRSSHPKRQGIDRVRPRSLDDRTWWNWLGRGQGGTTHHSRATTAQYHLRDNSTRARLRRSPVLSTPCML